jgi:TRAP-type uncharacterized transport system substrate-binding protein
MSDENGQGIGVNVYDEDDDELIEDEEAAAVAPQPVEIVREEIATVTKDNDSEDDLYEVVKAHSDQISRLTNIVESLQSQIKQIDQKRVSSKKTSSIRKNRSTTKTKKSKTASKKPKGMKSTKTK